MRLSKYMFAAFAAIAFAFPAMPLSADIVFDFVDNIAGDPTEALDGGGAGASVTISALTLTTEDILFPEYTESDDPLDPTIRILTPTGNILSAAAGDGGTLNINGSTDALGVNHPTVSNNGDWGDAGYGGTEGNDFNNDESWVFSFDQDVVFTNIEFESAVAGNLFTVLVDGSSIVTLDGPNGDVTALGALNGLTIAAGSEITFAASGPVATTDYRIESFEVDVVSVVPEPTSIALLGLFGLGAVARRRK